MDRNHTMEAPNNDELSEIEQIADRSELTTIYRTPGKQFEGELLSAEARDKVKADELEAITSGLGKHVLSIGLLIPYPFVSGLLLGVGFYAAAETLNKENTMAMVFAAFLVISLWMVTSYKAYAAVFKTFYKHALRAGPFITVMLISLIMASQAIYWIVSESFARQSLLFNSALMSLLLVVYSLVACFILLGIWGNSRVTSGIKALASGAVIVVSGFFVVATYLF